MATFEKALSQLESVVEELERSDVSLDRALALFESGIEHLRVAHDELTRAEASVKVLVRRAEGTLETTDLNG
jgi:exodeoxyribonuclease VII small subunit